MAKRLVAFWFWIKFHNEFNIFRSERLSSNPLHEQDSDSSSDEEIGDRNITQPNEDSVQQNSIDGITEESQAWFSTFIYHMT